MLNTQNIIQADHTQMDQVDDQVQENMDENGIEPLTVNNPMNISHVD